MKESTASAETVGDNLSASAEQTSSAMEQIAANVSSMRDRLATLEQTIDSNAAAVGSITTSIEGVVNEITDQTAMVEESTASVQLRDANRMFSEGVSSKIDSIREVADEI